MDMVFQKMTVPEEAAEIAYDRMKKNSGKCGIDNYLNIGGCSIAHPFNKSARAQCEENTQRNKDLRAEKKQSKIDKRDAKTGAINAGAQSTSDFNSQISQALSSIGATNEDGKLSTGAWIGISVVGIALIGTVVWLVTRKK